MLVSHEVPISLLNPSRGFNDYDYALVHLFEEYSGYFYYFKESLKLNRRVILDNSLYELGTSFDSEQFAIWIERLHPTEYIIPDVFENSEGTIISTQRWNQQFGDLPGKRIGVVHGKTYEDICKCYLFMRDNVDKIAFSSDKTFFREMNSIETYTDIEVLTHGRQKLLTRLLDDNIIDMNKKHHLLGCFLPQEFRYYREQSFKWIETIDTSSPVLHGLLNIKYKNYGLNTKSTIKLVDMIGNTPNINNLEIIRYNLDKFREINLLNTINWEK